MWAVRKFKTYCLLKRCGCYCAGRRSVVHVHSHITGRSREGEGETKQAEWHGIDGSQFIERRILATSFLVSARGLPGPWQKRKDRPFVKHIVDLVC